MVQEEKPGEKQENPGVTGNGEKVGDTTADYLAAIKELKENSVPRSEAEKLREENKRLLKAYIDGQPIEVDTSKPEEPTINELRKELLDTEPKTNLEFVTKMVNLRDKLIAEGKPDPFAPYGSQHVTTQAELDTAQHVAEVYKKCIEEADGDPDEFNNALRRYTRAKK